LRSSITKSWARCALGLEVTINPLPQEVPNPIRYDLDDLHAAFW
jgi:hypothetical protein